MCSNGVTNPQRNFWTETRQLLENRVGVDTANAVLRDMQAKHLEFVAQWSMDEIELMCQTGHQ